jgi:Arc/MetJ-type ribon-helix-helix transcriptional regulator
MAISLSPETEQLLTQRLEVSGYRSADELIRAGLLFLSTHGEFEPGELNRLLAASDEDELLDGDACFEEIHAMSETRRKAARA